MENRTLPGACEPGRGTDLTLPGGVQPFVEAYGRLLPGQPESVEDFFELAGEAEKALEYLKGRKSGGRGCCAGSPVCAAPPTRWMRCWRPCRCPKRAAACLKAEFYPYGATAAE